MHERDRYKATIKEGENLGMRGLDERKVYTHFAVEGSTVSPQRTLVTDQ